MSPGQIYRQAVWIARLLRIDEAMSAAVRSPRVFPLGFNTTQGMPSQLGVPRRPPPLLVELGCGLAHLLYWICRPDLPLRCKGSDFVPEFIAAAQPEMPHIGLAASAFAPHVATGSARWVFSHGVLPALAADQGCSHVMEILRILEPGSGTALMLMVPRGSHPSKTEVWPWFFHSTVQPTPHEHLPQCASPFEDGVPVGHLIRRVEFLLNSNDMKRYSEASLNATPWSDALVDAVTRFKMAYGPSKGGDAYTKDFMVVLLYRSDVLIHHRLGTTRPTADATSKRTVQQPDAAEEFNTTWLLTQYEERLSNYSRLMYRHKVRRHVAVWSETP